MSAFVIPEQAQQFIACNTAASIDRDGVRQTNLEGIPIWEVRAVSLPAPEPGRDRVPMPEILRVQVPSPAEPAVTLGQPVTFPNLTVRTWAARDGRQGLMYSASAVRPRHPQPSASAPAAQPSSGQTGK